MQRLLTKIFTCGSLASALFGCGIPYLEPSSNSVAFIEFIDEGSEPMGVQLYTDANECTDRMGVALVQPKAQRKVAVATGKELVFTTSMDVGSGKFLMAFGALGGLIAANTYKGCTPTIEFNPQAGRTYTFRMNSDGKDCSYQFSAKPTSTDRQDVAQSVPFVQREWMRAMGESGPWCKKK